MLIAAELGVSFPHIKKVAKLSKNVCVIQECNVCVKVFVFIKLAHVLPSE